MNPSRTRVMAITGATLALVMASTAVATAHPGRQDDRGFGFGPGRFLEPFRAERFGLRDEGPFGFGRRGLRMGLGFLSDGLVRTETTVDLGDDGIVTHRSDSGSVTSASDTTLDYTLATGEAASVTIGEETTVWALSQVSQDAGFRPFRGLRLTAEQIAPADIAVGSEVMVSATSQEDGSFLAHRIVVKPAAEPSDEAETDETDGAIDDPAADAAAAIEAPAGDA